MWFRFPKGAEAVTVERQQFNVEYKDKDGSYFRAPSHFTTQILRHTGFVAVGEMPPGAPEDLPMSNPATDTTINELTQTVEAQKAQLASLQTDINSAQAENTALKNSNVELNKQIDEMEDEIETLKEQLADAPSANPGGAPGTTDKAPPAGKAKV